MVIQVILVLGVAAVVVLYFAVLRKPKAPKHTSDFNMNDPEIASRRKAWLDQQIMSSLKREIPRRKPGAPTESSDTGIYTKGK